MYKDTITNSSIARCRDCEWEFNVDNKHQLYEFVKEEAEAHALKHKHFTSVFQQIEEEFNNKGVSE